jgi:hypothetical protein
MQTDGEGLLNDHVHPQFLGLCSSQQPHNGSALCNFHAFNDIQVSLCCCRSFIRSPVPSFQASDYLALHQSTNLTADRDNKGKSEEFSAHVLDLKIFPLMIKF